MNKTTLIGGPLDGAVVAVLIHHPETICISAEECRRKGYPIYTDP